jgi:uncharacterized protein
MDIKDPIHGNIEVNRAEAAILDSPEFQRLRYIKQLGFSEFSFPGATHNRFIHSLGVCHLAGRAFDAIFKQFCFSSPEVPQRLRQTLRLAALLHDIGHGPLSHTTEEVMPALSELNIAAYKQRKPPALGLFSEESSRQANHEDYTIKFLTDSPLTELMRKEFCDIDPLKVACLIDKNLICDDDFFKDQGIDFRTLLSQLVSSEIDVDRMDYLARDSYFCATSYGVVEYNWIIANLTYHIVNGEAFLALNKRAIYTFDDFLLSRHHMYLMVYFHHKSIIYEEMLYRFLISPDCTYKLPASIDAYRRCTDYSLYEHLAESNNSWAQKITWRQPHRVLFEMHVVKDSARSLHMKNELEKDGIPVIMASSRARLSKYHGNAPDEKAYQIFVVDHYDPREAPTPIDRSTEIFQKYEEIRSIERLYVEPKNYERGRAIITERRL